MNDLIRLMFDDGASRDPIGPKHPQGAIEFDWCGRKFIGILWTRETFGSEERKFNGWWFYRPDYGNSREDVRNFLKDPNQWALCFQQTHYQNAPGWGRELTTPPNHHDWNDCTHLMEIIEVA